MVKSKNTYTPFDIVSHVTEDTIADHLRVVYSEEEELPTYCAAAWNAVEAHIGENMTAGTITFESKLPYRCFTLPIEAERVDAVVVEIWNGEEWVAMQSENIHHASIGYPTEIRLDTEDDAWLYSSADSNMSYARMRGTLTYTAKTPEKLMIGAFLLKLGDIYTNRADVDVTKMEKHPRGFEDALFTFVKLDFDA